MISILLPFWFIIAIFSPALLLFLFVGVQSGVKPPIKAKAAATGLHMSAAPSLGADTRPGAIRV